MAAFCSRLGKAAAFFGHFDQQIDDLVGSHDVGDGLARGQLIRIGVDGHGDPVGQFRHAVLLLVAIEEEGIDGLGGVIAGASGRVENRIHHLLLADRRRVEVHVVDVRQVLQARQNGAGRVVPLEHLPAGGLRFRIVPQIAPSSKRSLPAAADPLSRDIGPALQTKRHRARTRAVSSLAARKRSAAVPVCPGCKATANLSCP